MLILVSENKPKGRSEKMKKINICFGIVGALLLGIGDWLLGFTDPSHIDGAVWNALVSGYTKNYSLLRPVIAMPLGFFGVLSYAPCIWEMGQIFKDKKTRKIQSIFMTASMGGWALLHYLYSAAVFVFAYSCRYIGQSEAVNITNALYGAVMPGMSLWLVFMLIPFILHFVDIARGKSYLPKKMLAFHTLVWWAVIYFGSSVLPKTAFTNGLKTFAMNGAMLVWLAAVLIYGYHYDIHVKNLAV